MAEARLTVGRPAWLLLVAEASGVANTCAISICLESESAEIV